MRFSETRLTGAFIIEPDELRDERGFFARTFCVREFESHGLQAFVAQCSVAFNHRRGTLRGLHYQLAPASESKLVRCTRGAVYDVIVDLRRGSPTYLEHVAVELSADNHRALYVPETFAHGYVTLADDTELTYQMSEFYTPGREAGLRYDDPALRIAWPIGVDVISEKDRGWPLTSPVALSHP